MGDASHFVGESTARNMGGSTNQNGDIISI